MLLCEEKSNFWKRCKEQGKQANHKHGDFIDFSQEFLFSLSPGQTVEQSWIQRSNFAGSNIVRPFGRPCWMVFIQHFCLIKCWIEFTFVQTLYPTILLNETMLQCFVALPTKCYPEVSHMGPAGQSRIAILFSSLGFSRHLPERWRTKRTSWLLMSSQRARKGKKKRKTKTGPRRSKFGRNRKLKLSTDVRFNSVKISANYSGFILINAGVSCSYDAQHTDFCSFSSPFLYLF